MKKRALLVGINRYHDDSVSRLLCAEKDALALEYVLQNHCGFSARSLVNDQATRQNILDCVRELCRDLKEEDLFLFYFAGHGHESQGAQVLLPVDVRLQDIIDEVQPVVVPVRGLENATRHGGAARVFVLDACRVPLHAGTRDGTIEMRDVVVTQAKAWVEREALESPPLVVMYSCSGHQRAHELEALGRGVFSKAFEEIILRYAENGQELALPGLVHEEISDATQHLLEEHGRPGRQNPMIVANRGRVVLVEGSGNLAKPVSRRARLTGPKAEPEGPREHVVGPGAVVEESILPKQRNDLSRNVVVSRGAKVKGRIYGIEVTLLTESYALGPIVGQECVDIQGTAQVDGSVIAGCKASISGKVNGDVWAPDVKLTGRVVISGRILSGGDLTIVESSIVSQGILCAGSVVVGDCCSVGGIQAATISAGNGASLGYAVCRGDFRGGDGVRFSVLRTKGSIELGNACAGRSVIADGDVTLGNDARVDVILATGNVLVGDRANTRFVASRSLVCGCYSEHRFVFATESIRVGRDSRLGEVSCNGSIAFEKTVHVDSPTVLATNGLIEFESPFSLCGSTISNENLFVVSGEAEREIVCQDQNAKGRLATAAFDHAVYETLCRLAGERLKLEHV